MTIKCDNKCKTLAYSYWLMAFTCSIIKTDKLNAMAGLLVILIPLGHDTREGSSLLSVYPRVLHSVWLIRGA
jgi:hypothetical protein